MPGLRFALLGSGSRGNATLVACGGTRILVDCGFGIRETEARLGRLGVEAGSLDAILVTHEHGDHLRGVGPLARRHNIALWMTPGTRALSMGGYGPRASMASSWLHSSASASAASSGICRTRRRPSCSRAWIARACSTWC